MPFCQNCGAQVQAGINFCPSCGVRLLPVVAPQQAPAPVAQPAIQAPPAAPPRPPGESVIAVVANLKKPKFLGSFDVYTVAVTEKRAIFARITNDMVNRAVKEAQEASKTKGGGFFDQWGAQLETSIFFSDRYKLMSPDEILHENSENFEVEHAGVYKIRVWEKDQQGNRSAVHGHWYEVEFETRLGKTKYSMDWDPRPELRRGFGSKVDG